MSEQLAWVYRGPLAGRDFLLMEAEDLEQAVRDDWAQPVAGTGAGMFPDLALHKVEQGPHEAAEAYAAKRGGYARRDNPGYATREVVAGPPPTPAPPKKVEEDEESETKPTPKRKPTPKKP